MAVTITKIELENYRQYKNVALSFDEKNDSNLHVLKAKNGTGKTTFINSITWCLYGEEKYINNADKALNLPNEKAIENTAILKIAFSLVISNLFFSSTNFVIFCTP